MGKRGNFQLSPTDYSRYMVHLYGNAMGGSIVFINDVCGVDECGSLQGRECRWLLPPKLIFDVKMAHLDEKIKSVNYGLNQGCAKK